MSIPIGKKFELYRSHEIATTNNRIPIILGKGRAFGSGEHETTISCLEELEKIPLTKNSKVLDLGCGTGILSIAAAKLGAEYVKAIDPDPHAIQATKNNIKLNQIEKIVFPILGTMDILKDENFNTIIANLYGDILLKIIRNLSNQLVSNGYLLLSGILFEYAYELKTALPKDKFKLITAHYLDEYTTIVYKKY